ncbi:hypothetical protein FUSPEROL_00601 [Fusobacterium periodonticum ATCC 33693]|uniref:Uncharacterized protein n=1 Tax=Fusobacterium periodonticum ATCC 33693 TaxID=546275 RepID=D4CT89_9FUSO|nr:hypothetical protein FUSPEROL_00601 [Fusobacterium periodonticum ATCC 33693]
MEFKYHFLHYQINLYNCLKVLSYWNLNNDESKLFLEIMELKVLSYWNLNDLREMDSNIIIAWLKVLSYWNLNLSILESDVSLSFA